MNNLKEKILRSVDIVQYVQKYVKLKRTGKDWFGCCPFHSERTASFSVLPGKQMYKCFGCGATGDVIDFCMRHVHRQLKFSEALQQLAVEHGLVVQEFKKEKRNADPEIWQTISASVMQRTMQHYHRNGFVSWLAGRIGVREAEQVAFENYIGTTRDGGTLFWQVDSRWAVRSAVRIRYLENGRRDKSTGAARLKGYTQADGFISCLYNEHKLALHKDAVVCIVESEKTAVLCGLYLPTFNDRPAVWLASSGMNGLTENKVKPLKKRDIVLVPDWSFASRAVWGAVPMRKLKMTDPATGRTTVKVHPDGEIDHDYVPASQRILAVGARSVSIYDPMPEVNTGADIADFLLKMPTPSPCQSVSNEVSVAGATAQPDAPFGW